MHEWQLYPQEKSLLSPWCQNLLMCYPMNSKKVWDIIFHSYNLDLALELSWKMPIKDNIHKLYIFQMHLLNQIAHRFIHSLSCTPKSRRIRSTNSKTRGPLPYYEHAYITKCCSNVSFVDSSTNRKNGEA
jgi:hypothetical protein